MRFSSSIFCPFFVGVLSTFAPSPFASAQNISRVVLMEPFYTSDYLETLAEEEVEEALKPQFIEVDEAGIDLIQRDTGNGQLDHAFVPNDPRFFGLHPENTLFYGAKQNYCESSDCDALPEEDQDEWFTKPFSLWFDETNCNIPNPLVQVDVDSSTPGLIENYFNTGVLDGSLVEADITSIGFRTGSEFPVFSENPFVLGVAFSLFWTDGNGDYTDIDGDRNFDVALREIYYNGGFYAGWTKETDADETNGHISFPAVATHEVGHTLGLSHFGSVSFLVKPDGISLEVAPKAIMNAFYNSADPSVDIGGLDSRPLCSIYNDWD